MVRYEAEGPDRQVPWRWAPGGRDAAWRGRLTFHCVVIDGVFASDPADGVVFHAASGLDEQAFAVLQAQVRRRLLRVFVRRGVLPSDDARAMAQWAYGGGFSVDASVRIEAADRARRERLLRYCARPMFALERLHEVDAERPAAPHPTRTDRPPRRPGAAAARPPPPLLRRPRTQLTAARCSHRPRAGRDDLAARRPPRGTRRRTSRWPPFRPRSASTPSSR
jgi:hypothetical protein